uniref:Uncharacterized protein n=1 Tax=Arion vulgaris TaxID=1028688 RepID=A0A0B7ARB6_9EUPU
MFTRIYNRRRVYTWFSFNLTSHKLNCLTNSQKGIMAEFLRPSSDMIKFKDCLSRAKHIVVLTGAGVSAESGVPTLEGLVDTGESGKLRI